MAGQRGPSKACPSKACSGWPRLAEARGSLRRGLALRGASGEAAGRSLSQLVFDAGVPERRAEDEHRAGCVSGEEAAAQLQRDALPPAVPLRHARHRRRDGHALPERLDQHHQDACRDGRRGARRVHAGQARAEAAAALRGCRPPTALHSLPTASLPTASLPTAHCPPPTAHCPLNAHIPMPHAPIPNHCRMPNA